MVGVQFLHDAQYLPSLRHPQMAAYGLGPEMGKLSDAVLASCDHIVKILTEFAINMGAACAIVMYDRFRALDRFPERPVRPGGQIQTCGPLARQGRSGA